MLGKTAPVVWWMRRCPRLTRTPAAAQAPHRTAPACPPALVSGSPPVCSCLCPVCTPGCPAPVLAARRRPQSRAARHRCRPPPHRPCCGTAPTTALPHYRGRTERTVGGGRGERGAEREGGGGGRGQRRGAKAGAGVHGWRGAEREGAGEAERRQGQKGARTGLVDLGVGWGGVWGLGGAQVGSGRRVRAGEGGREERVGWGRWETRAEAAAGGHPTRCACSPCVMDITSPV